MRPIVPVSPCPRVSLSPLRAAAGLVVGANDEAIRRWRIGIGGGDDVFWRDVEHPLQVRACSSLGCGSEVNQLGLSVIPPIGLSDNGGKALAGEAGGGPVVPRGIWGFLSKPRGL